MDKPAGLLSVPGKGEANQDCVASRLGVRFPHATGPLIVHRLDMDTSGLMVLALDPEAHRVLSRQFEARTTAKRYIAHVDGQPESDFGEIDLPIRLDVERRPIQIVDHVAGRPSLTRWRVLARHPGHTRLELEPVTGRTHQLRLHLASINLPILGDVLYGPQPRTRTLAPRLCLHAAMLEFDDPDSGERRRVESPAPF